MATPVFPHAPKEYDPVYMDQLLRVLTQGLKLYEAQKANTAGLSSQTFSVAPAPTGTMAPQASQLYATSILVNETFLVNNGNAGTAYVTGAVLASGAYGHEMWKAGAGGGDYTFTQTTSTTQITIATGKTLIQVIAGAKVCSTTFVLSWTGTAQARYSTNGTTPAGAYAASPIYITGQAVSLTMSIEFNSGTLFEPALIEGTLPLKAIRKNSDLVHKEAELYYEQSLITNGGGFGNAITGIATTTSVITGFRFRTTKISAPTVTLFSRNSTSAKLSSSTTGIDAGTTVTVASTSLNGVHIISDSGTGFTVGTVAYEIFYTANSRI